MMQLKIVDISGKILLTQDINNDSVEYTWNTKMVSDGIYFYRMYSEGVNVESGKILIHK